MSTYHELLERCQADALVEENKRKITDRRINAYNESLNQMREDIESLKEANELREATRARYKEIVESDMLSTVLKGIYIAALEDCSVLTKSNYKLAESLVESYVNEKGAGNILNGMRGKTYLLNTIYEAVEEAKDETEDETDDSDAEAEKVPDEPKETMMDKLDKEDDVQDAVKLISTRIADAEQEFIQKNAEDKEKIENIVNDINDRIESVKGDNTTPDDQKDEIAEETARIGQRKVAAVYEDRSHSIFETMVHQLSETVLKDPKLKPQYVDENGKLDMLKIIDTTKCMYGMLEFANTIQLEKVDSRYIENTLRELD